MSIKDATPEEIQALKAKINQRQADRRYEAEMDEVVRMVQKHPLGAAQEAKQPQIPPMESVIAATGAAAIAGVAAILGNIGAIPMGCAVMATGAGLVLAGTEVSRYVV